MLVSTSLTDAATRLRAGQALTGTAGSARLGLLIAGTAGRHPLVAADRYATEPAYRAAVDECAAIAAELGIAIPAGFVADYALVALLASWGIEPEVVGWHGAGGCLAAQLAGVLTLPDALALAHRLDTGAELAGWLSDRLQAGQARGRADQPDRAADSRRAGNRPGELGGLADRAGRNRSLVPAGLHRRRPGLVRRAGRAARHRRPGRGGAAAGRGGRPAVAGRRADRLVRLSGRPRGRQGRTARLPVPAAALLDRPAGRQARRADQRPSRQPGHARPAAATELVRGGRDGRAHRRVVPARRQPGRAGRPACHGSAHRRQRRDGAGRRRAADRARRNHRGGSAAAGRRRRPSRPPWCCRWPR